MDRAIGVPWAVGCRWSGACSRRRGSSSLSLVGRSVGRGGVLVMHRHSTAGACAALLAARKLLAAPASSGDSTSSLFRCFPPKTCKVVTRRSCCRSRGLGESAAAARTPTSRWPIRPEHEKHEPLGQVHWLRLHQRTRRLPEPAHRNSAPDGCSGCGSSIWLHRHPQLPDGNHHRGALGHSSRPAAARPVATADAAGRPVHEETAFECAAPSLCPQPRPARAVDAGDQRAVSWAAVVLSPGVLPAGRPLPSVAPLEPSIAPTAGHGTTPRSFVSRSSVSGTPGARSTRLDSAREQAPRRCCLPLAAAHASSLGHRRCTSWFFAYSLGVHVVCTSTHIVISGRVLMLMGRGQCELRVGAGRIL